MTEIGRCSECRHWGVANLDGQANCHKLGVLLPRDFGCVYHEEKPPFQSTHYCKTHDAFCGVNGCELCGVDCEFYSTTNAIRNMRSEIGVLRRSLDERDSVFERLKTKGTAWMLAYCIGDGWQVDVCNPTRSGTQYYGRTPAEALNSAERGERVADEGDTVKYP